ncbi:MAG: DUF488 domain-containing protein [Desulforhopalus sp.]|nr:DUF488 domain-containing protein [Desulforhopalus sp.]
MINPPTYNRQKLLLFLLEYAGGTLNKVDLQKLLFLYLQETGVNYYAFVPYRFGCYSFVAADDLDLLQKRGWLEQNKKELRLRNSIASLPWVKNNSERTVIKDWLKQKTKRGQELVREVYRKYPYYAINSEIKGQLLDKKELAFVNQAGVVISDPNQKSIYTIGYEGLHIEEYINRLIRKDIKLLCDVRQNPLSRKYGFSKRNLAALLPKFGIEYLHLPGLGIESKIRKGLTNSNDVNILFDNYKKNLPERQNELTRIIGEFKKHKRIALTCFERESQNCHRHCISDFLAIHSRITVCHL